MFGKRIGRLSSIVLVASLVPAVAYAATSGRAPHPPGSQVPAVGTSSGAADSSSQALREAVSAAQRFLDSSGFTASLDGSSIPTWLVAERMAAYAQGQGRRQGATAIPSPARADWAAESLATLVMNNLMYANAQGTNRLASRQEALAYGQLMLSNLQQAPATLQQEILGGMTPADKFTSAPAIDGFQMLMTIREFRAGILSQAPAGVGARDAQIQWLGDELTRHTLVVEGFSDISRATLPDSLPPTP
jgi:hypothetical protein